MVYLIIATGVIILMFFILPSILSNKKRDKQLQTLKDSWGKPNDEFRNFDWIEQFSLLKKDKPFHQLSQQTVNDIDFNAIFNYLDRTISKPGQQYLYYLLLRPTNDLSALQQFDELVVYFQKNEKEREDIQLLLLSLNNPTAHYISGLFGDNIYKKPKWAIWLKVDTVIVICMLLLAFKFKVLLIWLMIPFAVNMLLHLWNKNKAYQFVQSLPQLNRLINTAKTLNNNLSQKEFVVKSINALHTFQSRFRFLNLSSNSVQGEISQALGLFFLESVKALFLIEVHSFIICMEELQTKKEDIISLFEFVGGIDAAISTASLRTENPKLCKPQFITPKKQLACNNIYHPLINDCVANSLNIDQKSVLITGSNMSGKTTFIRTIAINSVLSQTVYTCFADAFITPFLKVFSSIRIDDDLLEGKSYFFEEVKTIDTLIQETATSFQNLFILDEVFKGTNTVERVAAAKAVLHYLNKNENIVLVSTHDLELSELLKEQYDLYHFEEQIVNEALSFDHLLKEGKLKTTNAIRLLELSGYPKEIIDEAKQLVK